MSPDIFSVIKVNSDFERLIDLPRNSKVLALLNGVNIFIRYI